MAGIDTDEPGSAQGSPKDDQKMLLGLIQRINLRDAGKIKTDDYTTIKEIEQLHEQEFLDRQMRRCISFRDMREYVDQEDEMAQMVLESDSEEERRYNWVSEPNSPRSKEMLFNPQFNKRMNELSKSYYLRDQYDNCYNQPKALQQYEYKVCKMRDKYVQTNVLELLGIDSLLLQSKKDQDMDQDSQEENPHEDRIMSGKMTRAIKKRKKLTAARMRSLPKFEIQDLIGNFDLDHNGDIIIISNGTDEQGNPQYEDKDGRKVNQRGYYLNDEGCVLNKEQKVIFRKEEVDEDGEIPAPFCYMRSDNKEEPQTGQTESSQHTKTREQSTKSLLPQSSEDFFKQVTKPMKAKPRKSLVPFAAPRSVDKSFRSNLGRPISKTRKIRPVQSRNDQESHVSIDQDFLINGNIGDVYYNNVSEIQSPMGLGGANSNQEYDVTQQSNFDMMSEANLDDIHMKMTRRPVSKMSSSRIAKKVQKKPKNMILSRQQKSMLMNESQQRNPPRAYDEFEKFNSIIQQNPLKLKQQKVSNKFPRHLLGDKMNERIQKHFTRNIMKKIVVAVDSHDDSPPHENSSGRLINNQMSQRSQSIASETDLRTKSLLSQKPNQFNQKGKLRDISEIYTQDPRLRNQSSALKTQNSQSSNLRGAELKLASNSSSLMMPPLSKVGTVTSFIRGSFIKNLNKDKSRQASRSRQGLSQSNQPEQAVLLHNFTSARSSEKGGINIGNYNEDGESFNYQRN